MTHSRIIFGIFLILIVGCISNTTNKKLEKEFIQSYTEIKGKCKESIIEILKPFELEDDTFKISEVYQLDLSFDESIYKDSELTKGAFIGIIFEPDSFDLLIYRLDPNLEAVNTCYTTKHKLLINNLDILFTDFAGLAFDNCLGLDTSKIVMAINRNICFRKAIMSTTVFGSWKPDTVSNYRFEDEVLNNNWYLKRENKFFVISSNNDTVLFDDFSLNGDSLKINNLGRVFQILTITKSAIVLSDFLTNNVHQLNKIE